ncbi:uncharacterized protein LOC125238959 [Leguminivora glycinivorella]|uniref:uncharacterized protein LOC125232024 n=1 Tax=Leguminivora glycinivorella TaxID=1035111 RepID=UPI00200FB20A|nr:uncharacterized protein LOC125232024 [Leguminivora glycinivorella]XP_048002416.1 uncharacterized protein LOC125238959 [Leguminivora glycinivorella]
MSEASAMLNIGERVIVDDTIESIEVHPYLPYNNSFETNDEVRIAINRQDIIVYPHESYLLIEGKFEKDMQIINNAMAFLFQDVRYELNGVEIDRTKNCGITTTMKGLVSYGTDMEHSLESSSWNIGKHKVIVDKKNDFSYTVPLSHLLGFAEDYKKVIVNAKHELILNRASTNEHCATVAADSTPIDVTITRIVWRMPVVKVSDREKLRLMQYVENDIPIPIAFRTWELYEYPSLPAGVDEHVWSIKTSTMLEKPRYVIIGLQQERKTDKKKASCKFDHVNLQNCSVYLNSQCYPYDSFNTDFSKDFMALQYNAYANFQRSYYGKPVPTPLMSINDYKVHGALVVIDTSRQPDTFNSGIVDIRVVMKFTKDTPTNVAAYCLILHDSMFEYSPLTGKVRKNN